MFDEREHCEHIHYTNTYTIHMHGEQIAERRNRIEYSKLKRKKVIKK